MVKVLVTLIQPALRSGGDKYRGTIDGKEFITYIPQSITRTDVKVAKQVEITFDPK